LNTSVEINNKPKKQLENNNTDLMAAPIVNRYDSKNNGIVTNFWCMDCIRRK
jgi:hypothetical protein